MKTFFLILLSFLSLASLTEVSSAFAMNDAARASNTTSTEIHKKLTALESQLKDLKVILEKNSGSQGFISRIQDKKPITFFIEKIIQSSKEIWFYIIASFQFVTYLPDISKWIGSTLLKADNYPKIGVFLLKIFLSLSLCLSLFFILNWALKSWVPKKNHKKNLLIYVTVYGLAYSSIPYGCYVFFSLLETNIYLRDLAHLIGVGVTLVLMLIHLSQLLLEPYRPHYRSFMLHDQHCFLGHALIKQFSIVGIGGYFFAHILKHLDMPAALYEQLLQAIAFIIAFMALAWISRYKGSFTHLLSKSFTQTSESLPLWKRIILTSWHIPLILLIMAIYLDFCSIISNGQSFIISMLLTTIIALTLAFLEDKFSYIRTHFLSKISKNYYPTIETSLETYSQPIDTLIAGIVYTLAGIIFLEVWGFEALSLFTSPTLQNAIQKLLVIGLIVLVVLMILRTGNFIFERYTQDLDKSQDHSSARVVTVVSILRNSLRIGLWIPALFLILSELGFDITPLVASVSIFSVAIGFGAQTLVKDVITGLFIILEDTVSVGDYVTLDSLTGTIEAMTIRTIALRSEDGFLHTMPFGSIARVSNLTRQYAYVVLKISVSYKQDIPQALAVLKEAFIEMRQEKKWGMLILGDLETKGIEDFQDNGVIVKILIKTVVLKQADVRREFNRRLKILFDEGKIILTNSEILKVQVSSLPQILET